MKVKSVVNSKYFYLLGLSGLLSACGGGGGESSSTAGPSAANQAPVAQIASVAALYDAGTVVALDGSLSEDRDGDKLTYSWTLASKPERSNASIGSAMTEKPTFTPDVAGKYTLRLVVNDGKADSPHAEVEMQVYTPIGGVLTSSQTLTKENNPYRVTSDVTVPHELVLNVGPGVEVLGGGKKLGVQGILNVAGNSTTPVVLNDLHIQRTNLNDAGPVFACKINIAWTHLNGGAAYANNPEWSQCTLTLTDSKLKGTAPIVIAQGYEANKIERNVFEKAGGIDFRLGSADPYKSTLSIVNNRFIDWTGDFAIRNTGIVGNADSTVKYNSFLAAGRVAVVVEADRGVGRIKVNDNYWGSTDLQTINSMVRGVDVTLDTFLTKEDSATPK